ncbi:DNA sulfur modification protein DndE [Aeromonas sp. 600276]|uniref:DNA sulfur modification protein DndE n=1 Tax=Aeromonas sp. 600276 TaxID=2712026 RepID=UPI003B9EAC8B
MIDNIRLSEKAKQQLIVIKRKTGIENWNVLCRWALCLSLAEESAPPFEDIKADSSVEINWKTFSGEYDKIYINIIMMKFHNDELSPNEYDNWIKIHIHRGISYLHARILKIDDFMGQL